LADLGLAIAYADANESARPPRRDIERALRDVQDALGVVGHEALRSLIGDREHERAPDWASVPAHAPDPARLLAFLDHDHTEVRREVLRLLSARRFAQRYDLSVPQHRERVFGWLRELADRGLGAFAFPAAQGGAGDIGKAIAVFETLAYHDHSLVVAFGVQFGLFGGSILSLGTPAHHERFLGDVASLELPGCYAMTEVGHGSNVRDIETVARYLPDSREFEVHSPTPTATKDWIGNAALHGRAATVFAQLETRGERHGVHAFVVPIRDEQGQPLPGVAIEDCGIKAGLNGVDNGRIRFEHVRIPRENLLDRFGGVEPSGIYSSAIPSDGRRFFTMLGTLVAGRISIAAAANSAAKVALTIAIRYADRRRQFGPEAGPETPVLDYLGQQRRLLVPLATTYAFHVGLRDLIRDYAALGAGAEPDRELETLAAGLKALASEHAVATIQDARQATGGRGYLAANRFGRLLADTDIFTTFEGANLVLLQLVAKGLLTEYREQFGDMRVWSVMRWLGQQAATTVAEKNPIQTRRTDEDHLRDADFQAGALAFREQHLLATAARRIKARIDDGVDSFEALNEVQDHVIELARAHVERVVFGRLVVALRAREESTSNSESRSRSESESESESTSKSESESTSKSTSRSESESEFESESGVGSWPAVPWEWEGPLEGLRSLYALSVIERERGWFLETGYIEAPKAKAIRAQVNALCRELRPLAVPLVDAFGIPDEVLEAPDGRRGGRSGPR
ncbi:MAG: acyl-CoA dehydrogenase, partial [Longimicrobiales bacterium]